jgi:ComF family protein
VRFLKNMQQWLFPNFCLGCRQSILKNQGILCLNCQNAVAETGKYVPSNFTEQILWGRFPYSYAFSTFYFVKNAIIQQVMHELKYNGNIEAGLFLGAYTAKYIQENQLLHPNSVLVPVPLSPKRLHQRGYNQSEVICQQMAQQLNIPLITDTVLRIKNTNTQIGKTRTDRLLNMELAFEITKTSQLEGCHIILVDDTITTGATVEACALELLKIKNTTISVATAAIAMNQ